MRCQLINRPESILCDLDFYLHYAVYGLIVETVLNSVSVGCWLVSDSRLKVVKGMEPYLMN